MLKSLQRALAGEDGHDIVEYAVSLAVIVVMVVGTLRLMGGNINNVFSAVATSLQSQRAD